MTRWALINLFGLFFFLLRSIDSVILIWYFSNDTKHILLQLQPSCPSMDTYRVTIFIHVAFIYSIYRIPIDPWNFSIYLTIFQAVVCQHLRDYFPSCCLSTSTRLFSKLWSGSIYWTPHWYICTSFHSMIFVYYVARFFTN
jgi:hypothetical protein